MISWHPIIKTNLHSKKQTRLYTLRIKKTALKRKKIVVVPDIDVHTVFSTNSFFRGSIRIDDIQCGYLENFIMLKETIQVCIRLSSHIKKYS